MTSRKVVGSDESKSNFSEISSYTLTSGKTINCSRNGITSTDFKSRRDGDGHSKKKQKNVLYRTIDQIGVDAMKLLDYHYTEDEGGIVKVLKTLKKKESFTSVFYEGENSLENVFNWYEKYCGFVDDYDEIMIRNENIVEVNVKKKEEEGELDEEEEENEKESKDWFNMDKILAVGVEKIPQNVVKFIQEEGTFMKKLYPILVRYKNYEGFYPTKEFAKVEKFYIENQLKNKKKDEESKKILESVERIVLTENRQYWDVFYSRFWMLFVSIRNGKTFGELEKEIEKKIEGLEGEERRNMIKEIEKKEKIRVGDFVFSEWKRVKEGKMNRRISQNKALMKSLEKEQKKVEEGIKVAKEKIEQYKKKKKNSGFMLLIGKKENTVQELSQKKEVIRMKISEEKIKQKALKEFKTELFDSKESYKTEIYFRSSTERRIAEKILVDLVNSELDLTEAKIIIDLGRMKCGPMTKSGAIGVCEAVVKLGDHIIIGWGANDLAKIDKRTEENSQLPKNYYLSIVIDSFLNKEKYLSLIFEISGVCLYHTEKKKHCKSRWKGSNNKDVATEGEFVCDILEVAMRCSKHEANLENLRKFCSLQNVKGPVRFSNEFSKKVDCKQTMKFTSLESIKQFKAKALEKMNNRIDDLRFDFFEEYVLIESIEHTFGILENM